MARYGRRHEHIVKSQAPLDDDRITYTAWCGDHTTGYHGVMPVYFTKTRSPRSCPKCQSKMLAAEIKANPIPYKLAERVNTKDPANPYGLTSYGYKSVYPVIDCGILADDEIDRVVAFVTIDNGWGCTWEVHGWQRTTYADHGEPTEPKVSGAPIGYDRHDLASAPIRVEARRLHSKEEALLLIPTLAEQGRLTTRQACLEADRAWIAKRQEFAQRSAREAAEREAERQKRREAEARERNALLADLREVLAEDMPNFTRDVIFRAALKAGFTEADLSAPAAVAPKIDDFDPKGAAA